MWTKSGSVSTPDTALEKNGVRGAWELGSEPPSQCLRQCPSPHVTSCPGSEPLFRNSSHTRQPTGKPTSGPVSALGARGIDLYRGGGWGSSETPPKAPRLSLQWRATPPTPA